MTHHTIPLNVSGGEHVFLACLAIIVEFNCMFELVNMCRCMRTFICCFVEEHLV